MRSTLVFITCFLCAINANSQKELRLDSFGLHSNELFVISEYREIQYESFSDAGGSRLPANLSAFNFYIDINGKTTYSNVVDVNYMYLRNYTRADSGEMVYLISKKNRPMAERKTNIQSARKIDQYSDIRSINDLAFGYWKKYGNRIIIVFRDGTTIKSMENLRIFIGFIVKNNIYLTRGMNSKDEYLFDYKFKRNKVVEVKLPLQLETIFYTDSIEDIEEKKTLDSVLKQQTTSFNATEGASLRKKQKRDSTLLVSIKYWHFESSRKEFEQRNFYTIDSDDLTFEMARKNKCGKKKYALLHHIKNGVHVYSSFKIKQYTNYFERWHQEEYIFIRVVDPYEENIKHVFRVPHSE